MFCEEPHPQPFIQGTATIEFDLQISHDENGQYWGFEPNSGQYQGLRVDDLAVYSDGSGNRYEYDDDAAAYRWLGAVCQLDCGPVLYIGSGSG